MSTGPFRAEHLARFTEALADRYRLDRVLGAGGMATVWLAHDRRHERRVAIKVLQPELSAVLGSERFLSEIRTAASLQHPHVLPLFDSGSADGLLYYVMPYVDGETLRDRLRRERQLPVADAVRIASEVADGLAYAHSRGVIHRDVKPENILLQDGHALVADFGIALAVREAGGPRLTQTGLSLGTPQYMAPEQAMGERSIDLRADVYALGAVTYEMLVGEPPHTGPTAQAIVAKIMTESPASPRRFRPSVPEHVEAAVLTALALVPADRFPTAAAFVTALTSSAGSPPATGRLASSPRHRWRELVIALGLAAAFGFAGWYLGRGDARSGGAAPPTRLALLAPGLGGSGAGALNRQVTVTADGAAVLFVGSTGDGGGAMLFAQRLDGDESVPVPGSTLSYAPSLSPDGRWIAARDMAGSLLRIPAGGTGEPIEPLARGHAFYAWHPDGSLYFTRSPYRVLERAGKGSDSSEVVLPQMEQGAWIQQVLPGGRFAIAIQAGPGATGGPCVTIDLETGARTTLVETPVAAARFSAGHLVYATPGGVLVAQRFDAKARRPLGEPITLATGVATTGTGDAQFDVAATGTLVYVPEEPRSLVLLDRHGVARLATEERRNYHMPRFSPDGRRLLTDFVSAEGRDVWLLDLAQKTMTKVTFDGDGHDGTWGPDGRFVTYTSGRSGEFGIWRVQPGRIAPPESLLTSPSLNFTGEWLPDASGLLTVALNLGAESREDIAIVRISGRAEIEPLVSTRFRENYPALSRDGRWVAFVSDQSGRAEVYVRPLAGSGEVVQISRSGGTEPVWSPTGRELYYRSMSDGLPVLVAAALETGGGVRVTDWRTLFAVDDFVTSTPHANYDVSPDGLLFALVRRNPTSRIVVLQNFPELVERRTREGSTAAR